MVSIPRDKNMNSTLDIAVIQTTCSPDGEANVDVTVGQIVDAARAGALPRAVRDPALDPEGEHRRDRAGAGRAVDEAGRTQPDR